MFGTAPFNRTKYIFDFSLMCYVVKNFWKLTNHANLTHAFSREVETMTHAKMFMTANGKGYFKVIMK